MGRLLPNSPAPAPPAPPPPPAAGDGPDGATSGCGSATVVVLNRSSSSFRAEYLSPAGADWASGTFLVAGGRVLAGGWEVRVRGSETLLVLTRKLLLALAGLVSAPELNREVNR